ncbi:RNA-directed DNA polymerase from mobile element jockey [Trichonephila clavipes]|nr:RNA-directed DNA polymerase from mobile element jockey [Trichonephila clavipes]
MAPTAPTYYAARGTCSILDIAFAKNLILEDINSVNDLSSDHNPVLIDLALNNSLPKNLRTLKSTNWIKFQEIVFNSIPGNPIIDTNNIDNAINNFTGMITSAISATTVTKVISTPHLRLPHRIRELIKIKTVFVSNGSSPGTLSLREKLTPCRGKLKLKLVSIGTILGKIC